MATYYVSSVDGSDADDGSTWALAKQTITGALAVATSDGDIIYVDSAHAYSVASAINWNATARVAVISVDRNGSSTTGHNGWLAGASEAITLNGGAFTVAGTGAQTWYAYGLSVLGNTGNSGGNDVFIASAVTNGVILEMESCTIACRGSNTGALLFLGPVASSTLIQQSLVLRNCTVQAPNHNGSFIVCAMISVQMINIAITYYGATKPLACFTGATTGVTSDVQVINSDLSGYNTTSGVIVSQTSNRGSWLFMNCKFSSTPSFTNSGTPFSQSTITVINCDSSDTKITFAYYARQGSIVQSTSIYASGGGTHDATAVSWLVTTTANCSEHDPFVTPWIEKWGSSTSAQTQTIEYVRNSAVTMDNREIWAEFERVSDASFPKGTLLSVRHANPFDGTGADWGSGAAYWTGTGGSAVTGKLTSGSITPAEKSLLRARVSVGVASITDLYLDPKLRIA